VTLRLSSKKIGKKRKVDDATLYGDIYIMKHKFCVNCEQNINIISWDCGSHVCLNEKSKWCVEVKIAGMCNTYMPRNGGQL
jgi:hypothetical protein